MTESGSCVLPVHMSWVLYHLQPPIAQDAPTRSTQTKNVLTEKEKEEEKEEEEEKNRTLL